MSTSESLEHVNVPYMAKESADIWEIIQDHAGGTNVITRQLTKRTQEGQSASTEPSSQLGPNLGLPSCIPPS